MKFLYSDCNGKSHLVSKSVWNQNFQVRKHQPEMDEILIKFEEHLLQPET